MMCILSTADSLILQRTQGIAQQPMDLGKTAAEAGAEKMDIDAPTVKRYRNMVLF